MTNTAAPTITVTARRWAHGWELTIDDNNTTQVRALNKAVQQVRDYLDTHDENTDHSEWNITVVPDIPRLNEIRNAQQAMTDATVAMRDAAQALRTEARALRRTYSVTDTAAILGVSRGRISQLTK